MREQSRVRCLQQAFKWLPVLRVCLADPKSLHTPKTRLSLDVNVVFSVSGGGGADAAPLLGDEAAARLSRDERDAAGGGERRAQLPQPRGAQHQTPLLARSVLTQYSASHLLSRSVFTHFGALHGWLAHLSLGQYSSSRSVPPSSLNQYSLSTHLARSVLTKAQHKRAEK